VTHGTQYLPHVDRIIAIKDGEIIQDGSFGDLISQDGYVKDLLGITGSLDSDGNVRLQKLASVDSEKPNELAKSSQENPQKKTATTTETEEEDEENKDLTGEVSWETYRSFARHSGGSKIIVFMMVVCMSPFIMQTFTDIYVGEGMMKEFVSFDQVYSYLKVFAFCTCFRSVFHMMTDMLINSRERSSKISFHDDMFDSLSRASLTTFFDRTPVGTITTRFTRDLDNIGGLLWCFTGSFRAAFHICTMCFLICYCFPLMGLFLPLVGALVWSHVIFGNKTRVILNKLEKGIWSPITTHFSETLGGISTIRTAEKKEYFRQTVHKRFDKTVQIRFAQTGADIYNGCVIAVISVAVQMTLCAYFVYMRNTGPALMALVLSHLSELTGNIYWLEGTARHIESSMMHIQRMDDFCKVKSEGEFETKDPEVSLEGWPAKGAIAFENYSTHYRPEMPLVLNNITCSIKPREKIGIVGRTGAGKSTITLSIFRILNPVKGSLKIDGIDITKIGLRLLRSSMSLIPQDPILFAGSLRFNMDPFNEYKDDHLLDCLHRVGMKSLLDSWDDSLSHDIKEGGENLSVGERQLVCIARALVRGRKIVLIDEATASVDSSNDQLIQKSIREYFANSTVLTIAHRINTILHSDRIMVLSDGKLAEFDTPRKLQSDSNSQFSALLKKSGRESSI